MPVSIEADGIGRYPRDAEAAAYFCTLEALQNVAKYAHASQVTITLSCPDGCQLTFTITDDGAGFDTTTAPRVLACRAWPTGWTRWAAHSTPLPPGRRHHRDRQTTWGA